MTRMIRPRHACGRLAGSLKAVPLSPMGRFETPVWEGGLLRVDHVGSALTARHYAVRGAEFLMSTFYLERLRLFARDRFLWTLLTDSRLLVPSDASFVAAA